ncbi:hypothetical protein EDB84DRAFT_1445147, partial [Lactarius hengduanensis]
EELLQTLLADDYADDEELERALSDPVPDDKPTKEVEEWLNALIYGDNDDPAESVTGAAAQTTSSGSITIAPSVPPCSDSGGLDDLENQDDVNADNELSNPGKEGAENPLPEEFAHWTKKIEPDGLIYSRTPAARRPPKSKPPKGETGHRHLLHHTVRAWHHPAKHEDPPSNNFRGGVRAAPGPKARIRITPSHLTPDDEHTTSPTSNPCIPSPRQLAAPETTNRTPRSAREDAVPPSILPYSPNTTLPSDRFDTSSSGLRSDSETNDASALAVKETRAQERPHSAEESSRRTSSSPLHSKYPGPRNDPAPESFKLVRPINCNYHAGTASKPTSRPRGPTTPDPRTNQTNPPKQPTRSHADHGTPTSGLETVRHADTHMTPKRSCDAPLEAEDEDVDATTTPRSAADMHRAKRACFTQGGRTFGAANTTTATSIPRSGTATRAKRQNCTEIHKPRDPDELPARGCPQPTISQITQELARLPTPTPRNLARPPRREAVTRGDYGDFAPTTQRPYEPPHVPTAREHSLAVATVSYTNDDTALVTNLASSVTARGMPPSNVSFPTATARPRNSATSGAKHAHANDNDGCPWTKTAEAAPRVITRQIIDRTGPPPPTIPSLTNLRLRAYGTRRQQLGFTSATLRISYLATLDQSEPAHEPASSTPSHLDNPSPPLILAGDAFRTNLDRTLTKECPELVANINHVRHAITRRLPRHRQCSMEREHEPRHLHRTARRRPRPRPPVDNTTVSIIANVSIPALRGNDATLENASTSPHSPSSLDSVSSIFETASVQQLEYRGTLQSLEVQSTSLTPAPYLSPTTFPTPSRDPTSNSSALPLALMPPSVTAQPPPQDSTSSTSDDSTATPTTTRSIAALTDSDAAPVKDASSVSSTVLVPTSTPVAATLSNAAPIVEPPLQTPAARTDTTDRHTKTSHVATTSPLAPTSLPVASTSSTLERFDSQLRLGRPNQLERCLNQSRSRHAVDARSMPTPDASTPASTHESSRHMPCFGDVELTP